MDEKGRVERDIEKLEREIEKLKEADLTKKYSVLYRWIKDYLEDAKHFLREGDYFTSFGCVSYAYGMVDGILLVEGKK